MTTAEQATNNDQKELSSISEKPLFWQDTSWRAPILFCISIPSELLRHAESAFSLSVLFPNISLRPSGLLGECLEKRPEEKKKRGIILLNYRSPPRIITHEGQHTESGPLPTTFSRIIRRIVQEARKS
ncbi:hypothetical protein NPIL_578231 [Nephila pilipes]|uniref:Uncharacterized protein n=1 Tax=Nephila pilipes TaxID=299642 RepID=A0A8X6PA08_NEPPI|nr:hypothetical protein NPIL_578231 [Nephila pilipes]